MAKFRAKNRTKGWVYGDLSVISIEFGDWSVKDFGIYSENEHIRIENIDDNTIGQGSTVLDKNGVEMYEGDIVHGAAHWLERYKPAVVTFRNGSFGLLWHRGDVEEFNPFTSMCNVEYEVVGNIFDNPELMEGE